MRRLLQRSKRYFRENLGIPFIVGFQILLIACGILLSQNNSALATEVAVYAYYLLTAGVVLQLVSFLRLKKKVDLAENR